MKFRPANHSVRDYSQLQNRQLHTIDLGDPSISLGIFSSIELGFRDSRASVDPGTIMSSRILETLCGENVRTCLVNKCHPCWELGLLQG